jgi:hypothetical protein
MNNNVKLSSPWMTYFNKYKALFGDDPEINVTFDDAKKTIKLYVNGDDKAEALSKILPSEKVFGNVVIKISVVPSNALNVSKIDVFQKAFEGNPALSYIKSVKNGLYDASYVVFSNKVVQFFNDELSDVNGFCSTLYQDIAKDIFEDTNGVFFCTDVPRD